ncbi:hypothetical protein B0H11DRAFT_2289736 [Mycena galericulata]|nr:hypothetical protein B0H11DRAFT_2289736 [Mycena galericulata]
MKIASRFSILALIFEAISVTAALTERSGVINVQAREDNGSPFIIGDPTPVSVKGRGGDEPFIIGEPTAVKERGIDETVIHGEATPVNK